MMAFQETRELLLSCTCRVALLWNVKVITNVIDSSGWTLAGLGRRETCSPSGVTHLDGATRVIRTAPKVLLFAAVQRSSTTSLRKIDNSITGKWITHTWITATWTMAVWTTACLAWTTATSAT